VKASILTCALAGVERWYGYGFGYGDTLDLTPRAEDLAKFLATIEGKEIELGGSVTTFFAPESNETFILKVK
jgi:hypothetical protein